MRSKIISVLCCILLALTLCVVSGSAQDSQEHFPQGVQALSQGDYPTAATKFEATVQEHPDWFMGHLLLARALIPLGQHQEAFQHLSSGAALASTEDDRHALREAWWLLLRYADEPVLRRRVARVLKAMLDQAAARGDADAEDFLLLGHAQQVSGDPRAALDSFRKAIRKEPVDWMPRYYEGRALTELKRFPDAERSLKVALDRCREGCEKEPIWVALAQAYEGWDRPDPAAAAYLRAGDEAAAQRLAEKAKGSR